jgi:uncharacterized membrane protein
MNPMELSWPEDRSIAEQRYVNVGEYERWASVVAGAGLLMAAAARRSPASAFAALAGGVLLYRGTSGHCPAYEALGRNTATDDTRVALGGRGGIRVQQSVTISRPIHELYSFWRQFENLPRFMEHLEAVSDLGAGRSHWVAKAPAGRHVEWDAEIINEVPDQVIGWRSLEGADVVSAGSVNFDDAGADRGTRVTVHLQYDPPGGKLGSIIAKMFGEEPSQQIHEDLRRLKELLEAGEVPTINGQTSGREKAPRRQRRRSA